MSFFSRARVIRDTVVRDEIDTIGKLSRKQILLPATIDRYRRWDDPRVRAYFAVRWCKAKWPKDDPLLHKPEADKLFARKLTA